MFAVIIPLAYVGPFHRLAAKKVKKKDIATVDHSKMNYEPFRKDFYRAAPEVEAMDQEDVDLLRLAMDGIKIRGVECPKPVTKWSQCGLPSTTLVASGFWCPASQLIL